MAPHHLPFYLAPGSGTDVLMVVMGIFLVAALVWVGTLYLRLHSLPERMAHKVGEIAVRDRGHFGPAGALHAHPPVLGGGTAACHDRYPRFRYTVAQHRRVSREDSRHQIGYRCRSRPGSQVGSGFTFASSSGAEERECRKGGEGRPCLS